MWWNEINYEIHGQERFFVGFFMVLKLDDKRLC
jgi:hypothetical protein